MASQASSPVYNLTSFVGGISDYTDKGIAGSGQWSSGLNIRSGDDALVCQQALVQESEGVFEDLILWFVPAPDGNCYGFGDQGRIYKRDSGVIGARYTQSLRGKSEAQPSHIVMSPPIPTNRFYFGRQRLVYTVKKYLDSLTGRMWTQQEREQVRRTQRLI